MTECKKCGGAIPYGSFGNVRCEYCNTVNYVSLPQEGKTEVKISAPLPQEPKVEEPAPVNEKVEEAPKEDSPPPSKKIKRKPSKFWYSLPVIFALLNIYLVGVFMNLRWHLGGDYIFMYYAYFSILAPSLVGLVEYIALKERNNAMAVNCLLIGAITSAVVLGISLNLIAG